MSSFNYEAVKDLLRCPKSHAELAFTGDALVSCDPATRLRFPIVDGFPVLLVDEAVTLPQDEWAAVMRQTGRDPATGEAAVSAPSKGGTMLDRRLCLAFLFLLPAFAMAEPQDDGGGRYEFREDHDPDGIGKFYMGREIAQVMSFHGAPWLNRREREQEERLSLMIKLLDLQPGQIVADIGAGSGVITERLARAVGRTGKVYAVDIQDEMLTILRLRMRQREIHNVVPVLGEMTSPKLEPESIDLMLLVDVYHEFSHPYEMTQAMVEALKPGGQIVLVEYRKEDPRIPIKEVHKMSEAQVKKELLQPEFGLEWVTTHPDLPRQHVIVFRKAPASTQ
jgi:precorrin-6B methylase 2/uncharacterized protein YbaR (Trm112 family)